MSATIAMRRAQAHDMTSAQGGGTTVGRTIDVPRRPA
jgi:hypothetical protein